MSGFVRMGVVSMRMRGTVKYLKKGWNRKEWRGNKNFKKWVKLGQGVGALKRGLLPPYKLWFSNPTTYKMGLLETILNQALSGDFQCVCDKVHV